MEIESLPEADVVGWGDWLLTFQGILSIVSLAVIVICATSLFRDWQRSHKKKVDVAASKQK